MADWLKIGIDFPDKPEHFVVADFLGIEVDSAVVLALRWLRWLDQHTEDGCTGLSGRLVDAVMKQKGYADALVACGWAALDEHGDVCAVNFSRHNGETAKKRALNANRVKKARSNVTQEALQKRDACNENVTQEALQKRDQIREEKNIYNNTLRGNNTVDMEAGAMGVPLPGSAEEVRVLMAGTASCALDARELVACATAFFEESEAVGWVLKGQPVRDWRAMARAFMARWQNNLRSGGAKRSGGNGRNSELNKNVYGNL